ncbi:MAG: glycosyltransferase [Methanobrevibacter sp.]|jgi:glycosyltransferase involved in cell wall biosynthesis|nr:glycosyltransferase [Candidatus Methanovirga meridionalis]
MDLTLISISFNARIGGIGTYSKEVYAGMKKEKGIKVKLISQDNKKYLTNTPVDYFFFIFETFIKIGKSDIYHALQPLDVFSLNKNKSVVTVHDLFGMRYVEGNSLAKYFTKFLFKKAIQKTVKCKKIIVDNQETANDLMKNFDVDSNKIHIIKPAISRDFHPEYFEHEEYIIGTVSGLGKRKRIDILIKSFLKANIKNSKLLIGGKGAECQNLKKLANDNDRIKFLGFIPADEMTNFYNSLDVFVFPTFLEGYGLPIIEAMACGKPVITLEDADIPKDIKNKTHISSINNLANDLKEKKFNCDIKSNLDFAKEHYPEQMIKQIIEVYKSMI